MNPKVANLLYTQIGVFCYYFLITTSTIGALFMFFGTFVFFFNYVFGISNLSILSWVFIGLIVFLIIGVLFSFIKWYEIVDSI